jgi:hypothetical protein
MLLLHPLTRFLLQTHLLHLKLKRFRETIRVHTLNAFHATFTIQLLDPAINVTHAAKQATLLLTVGKLNLGMLKTRGLVNPELAMLVVILTTGKIGVLI